MLLQGVALLVRSVFVVTELEFKPCIFLLSERFSYIFFLTFIVMGSLEHSLSSLTLEGSLRADGESFREDIGVYNGRVISTIGPGGGSGGTVLLFVQSLVLGNSSMISTAGGLGSPSGGGGGGGGRVHFHWSDILVGDEYIPLASVEGTIHAGLVYSKCCVLLNFVVFVILPSCFIRLARLSEFLLVFTEPTFTS